MATSPPDLQQLKSGLRAMWMAGDFGVIAKTIGGGAEDYIQRLALSPGTHVLDVACGTGNTSLPLARSGCVVIGLDIAPNLLEQARTRAAADHLSIQFDEGDAEALPYPDASFDVVLSMFGAMFAPRPEFVVRECARVLRPGGLLAMANWNPAGFSGRMFQLTAQHVPPPPGIPPPALWGDEPAVRRRLADDFSDIRTALIPLDFDMPANPAGVVNVFRTYFGPTQTAFRRLDAPGQTAFTAAMEHLWSSANVASDPDTHTLVRNEYLEVLATRR